ncbi:unnamed protein product [Schistosoma curassoni]|uniref:CCHC-type domain-containing protein n=1 Tax=Schistosoma curassoni TaxID=6186 RepID=A0A183KQX1_9TREM|nr:unnamed protein product [Schistosoma curassoni]
MQASRRSFQGQQKFGKCLFSGKFHSRNSCVFRNAKCFKCGKIGHIQSVCKTTVHFAASNVKLCDSDPIKLSVSNDHLPLSTISKTTIESYVSPELNEALNHSGTELQTKQTYTSRDICRESCRGSYSENIWSSKMHQMRLRIIVRQKVSSTSAYQISHISLPDIGCPNDSHMPGEFSYKNEEDMSNESNHDPKSDAILIDADFSNDRSFSNEILNKSEENI